MKELLRTIGSAEIETNDQLNSLCNTVRQYYIDNKRHKYSEVSTFLMETSDIEYLLENLRKIQVSLNESKNDEEDAKRVFKLIDHITLELNRTKYNSKNFSEMQVSAMNFVLNNAMKEIKTSNDELRLEQKQKIDEEVEEFRKETKGLKGKVEDSYTQFVAILGIFSAIVMVFFGGMTAFSSLFTTMQYISRYKLVFITTLVGMLIFNFIFMFFYILAKLLGREICSSETSISTSKKGIYKWMNNVWSKYPYIIIFNITVFSIMILSFICWYGSQYLSWRI